MVETGCGFDTESARELSATLSRGVEEGERPGFLSARDGKWLRIVPKSRRMAPERVRASLQTAFATVPGLGDDFRAMEGDASSGNPNSRKIRLYIARSHAYRVAGVVRGAAARSDARPPSPSPPPRRAHHPHLRARHRRPTRPSRTPGAPCRAAPRDGAPPGHPRTRPE